MKICTKCKLDKNVADFYTRKNGSLKTQCKACVNALAKAYHTLKPANAENRRINSAHFRKTNPDYNKIQLAEFHAANPDYNKLSLRKWRKEHPDKNRAKKAKERAVKLQAMPKWLSKEQIAQINEIYKNCPKGYHVDHITPLRGKNVMGLHAPWNLQYLTAQENLSKSNKVGV